MKKILFLSSALIMTVCGAFAEDVAPTTDKKITGGAGTCTVDVLGVSDNNATANTIATWSLNSYDCTAGQYLDETTLNCIECPTGSYCPGGTFTVEANNSKTACPTDYTSDAAATAESECYMGCELACSTNVECPAHSKNCVHSEFKTTGKQYVDAACNAYPSVCPVADFQCDIGYSKTEMTAVEVAEKYATLLNAQARLNPAVFLYCGLDGVDMTPDEENNFKFLRNNIDDCYYLSPGQIMILPEDMSFIFILTVTKNEYSPKTTPGAINMDGARYLLRNADFKPAVSGDNMWYRYSNILLPTADTVNFNRYINGDIVPPENITTETEMLEWASTVFSKEFINKLLNFKNGDEAVDEMRLLFETYRNIPLPNTWVTPVVNDNFGLLLDLNSSSIFSSITQVFSDDEALNLLFGGAKYCNNNTININWNPDNGKDTIQNMCLYDGTIDVPSDPVKPGYTFMGWKLVETTTTTE